MGNLGKTFSRVEVLKARGPNPLNIAVFSEGTDRLITRKGN
jgi:hypothetical protein